MSLKQVILVSSLSSIISAALVVIVGAMNKPVVAAANNKALAAILSELKQINSSLGKIEKQGLQPKRNNQPTSAKLSTKNRPALGNANAPITIVEYSDYQCPFCKKFVDNTLPGLKQKYIDTGKVRLVFKDLPLSFHANAKAAAIAAQCAGEQGKYWAMHDVLFKNTKNLQKESLIEYAGQAGINVKRFTACLTSDRFLAQVGADIAEAQKAQISGTPTFVIGKTTPDIVVGEVIRGAQPLESLGIIIERQLGK